MDSIKIKDYMDKHPVLLTADMSLAIAVEKLLASNKNGAPVVDHIGQLVGFLSQQDCLSVMLKSSYHCDMTSTVKDCMKSPVLSVTPDESILELADQMLGAKPKIYPVVSAGKVIGTINRTNVLKAMNIYMQQCYLSPI
ncbi:CBS domain-containing protein [Shewanella sp. SR43-4]|jgi:predicted transcriptional regulator|uniref:CBS domain-containing protein n=1 Tax=Shewanella vesiculosa TaxID=518738 RepID=A0ABV0FVJ4_9GAMM|nr:MULTISPECIES: CBS domain-containing protein [Shewanella]NCQ43908.1 CBS domain-containing protein [Shewanella frigidimarina]MBB1316579.1 CBS domain-containing protein [Shewanella sp. SR43-4]MBB1320656.1 CBS domain-containing protein [Shewanella sp. SR43-8]MBB1388278.1 CBS domain-containing protein [Shewanella sp. SG44-6]MBB1477329.1 CBS domain-containing protein [Shewanella sp. SG41-3]|tara:strand:- start:2208 stop:2624 length:417 start_codon:yes stop_codon:yes gene_type:complete